MNRDAEALLGLWRMMTRIRAFELSLAKAYEAEEIPGHIHLCLGQEAIAAGVCAHLERNDVITSTHRGHGHALAKGCDPAAMMAEIFGRSTGLCGGQAGSMHLAEPARGLLASTGIVGANAPLALGAALTAKTLGSGAVAVAFLGDGAANQGQVFEAMNMAAALALPCLFVIEDNGYGEFTASAAVTGTDDLAARMAAFGMPAKSVDGTDAIAVAEAAGEAITHARNGNGPAGLVCRAARLSGHFEGDAQVYRTEPRRPALCGPGDPLMRFRERAVENETLDPAALDRIEREAGAEMDEALASARAAPWPAPHGRRRRVAGKGAAS